MNKKPKKVGWLKKIWNSFWRYDPQVKALEKLKQAKLKKNLYGFETTKEFAKNLKFTMFFKRRFLIPIVYYVGHLLEKNKREIPKREDYKNLVIFNKAVEQGIRKWLMLFYVVDYKGGARLVDGKKLTAEEFIEWKLQKSEPCRLINIMKDGVTRTVMEDSAYKNLFDIVMFEIALEMNKQHPKNAPHLLFAQKTVDDVGYFLALENIQLLVRQLNLDPTEPPKTTPEVKVEPPAK